MPTLTFSWSDLALLGLTVGLFGSVCLVGRSAHSGSQAPPRTPSSEHQGPRKRALGKKKQNCTLKKAEERTPKPDLDLGAASRPASCGLPAAPAQILATPLSSSVQGVRSQQSSSSPQKPAHESQPRKEILKGVFVPSTRVEDPAGKLSPPPLSSPSTSSVQPAEVPSKRPLAERKQPPVRKTKVDDMIDRDIEKPFQVSRVMAIVGPPASPQIPTAVQTDASDVDDEEGWEKVPDSKKSRSTAASTISIGSSRVSASNSNSSIVKSSSTSQPSSKRQRQNAKKKEAAKAMKASQEAERLAKLGVHKKIQTNERIKAQASKTSGSPESKKPQGHVTGGGMKASIAEDGRLIWE